jgi:hypothetical protein
MQKPSSFGIKEIAMPLKHLGHLGLALSLTWPSLSYAGQDAVAGLWNLPEHQGTLELKDDGTFVSKRATDGHEITGIWKVITNGRIELMRGQNGPGGVCHYTVTEAVLIFSQCPVEGEYVRAQ